MNPTRRFGRNEYMNFYSYTYAPAHNVQPALPVHHFPARQALLATAVFVAMLSIGTSGIYWRANQLVVSHPTSSVEAVVSGNPKPIPIALAPAVAEQTSPTPPPPSAEPVADKELQAILESWAANHPAYKWSVAVQGIDGNKRFASFNADSKRPLASIYKLFLTYPLFQKLPLDKFDQTYLSVDGTSRTVGDCVNAMLRQSDNACGVAIGGYVGWARADKVLSGAGFNQTKLNGDYGTQSSAADTAKLLKEIYNGSLYTEQQRQYILNILKQQTKRDGIPAGCSDCIVANKTGELAYVNNDAGIVYYINDVYAVVIFSDGADYSYIAALTNQIKNYMAAS